MLEIFALIYLTRRVGDIAREKGRKAGWFKFMTVVLWFGCEIGGGIVGAVAAEVAGWPEAVAYLLALAGAAVGAGLSILIVKTLPARDAAFMQQPPPPPTFS
jgi:hypothetical protein